MQAGTLNYGSRIFCLKVPKALSPTGEIYVHGDRIDIDPTGALVVVGGYREVDDAYNAIAEPKEQKPLLVLAAGQWLAYYAASALDGSAVAVDIWRGEVER